MTNSELKKLCNSIKPTENELNEMENAKTSISNIVRNNIDKNVIVTELRVGGSYKKRTIIKGRKEIDMVVVISPKNKQKLLYKDLANLSMNSIENSIYLNYYEKLKDVDDNVKITRNYDRNTLSMKNNNNVSIDFLVKFKKEQLIGKVQEEVENFYLERDEKQINFVNFASEKYTLFKNSVMLLKYFRNLESFHSLKSYMIEIILYYSLVKYNKENSYLSYLNSFLTGLKDFIDKKTIEINDEMYMKLSVTKSKIPNDVYKVLDVANRSNNVAKHIKSSDIVLFSKFYEKYKDYFKEDNSVSNSNIVNSEVSYLWNENKSEFKIISKIEKFSNYELKYIKNQTGDTFKLIINDFYKHINRIVKITAKHNLGKTIAIKCDKQLIDIYENYYIKGKNIVNLSKEQINNYSQLKTRINYEGIKIIFKPL